MALVHQTAETVADSEIDSNLALLNAGSIVVLELSSPTGQKKKFHSTLIGYLSKQFILLEYPDQKKLGQFSAFIKPGITVTLRGVHEGLQCAVVAFSSHLRQTLLQPSKMIVLEYPKKIRVLYLRKGIRLQTKIEASAKIDDSICTIQVTNVSSSGCQLIYSGEEPLTLANDKEIDITVLKHKEQGSFSFKAIVCNFKQLKSGLSIGVRFIEKSLPEINQLLHLSLAVEE